MFKKIITIILCICACAAFVSCSDVVDVKSNEYGFDDAETGIGYVMCGKAVFAIKVGKVYAEDERGNEYCEIQHEDPTRFLCANDTDLPYVYRAKDEPEITMENFNPVAAFLSLNGETVIDQFTAEPIYTGDENAQDDSEYTYAIRDAINNSDPVLETAPSSSEMNTSFTAFIMLVSKDYPGLYYDVVFWRDLNGVNYIMDKNTNFSYLCPYKVTARLWESAQ